MVVGIILKSAGPFVPVAGSVFGFVKTCSDVYNVTSPTRVLVAGIKGILIDCTPLIIKYPALCAGVVACRGCAWITGNFNYLVGAVQCCTEIVER